MHLLKHNNDTAILTYLAGLQHDTIFATQPYGLPLNETTTPQYLKSLGYRTHGVGKVKRDKLTVVNSCNVPNLIPES